jgi:hypothetical protein
MKKYVGVCIIRVHWYLAIFSDRDGAPDGQLGSLVPFTVQPSAVGIPLPCSQDFLERARCEVNIRGVRSACCIL